MFFIAAKQGVDRRDCPRIKSGGRARSINLKSGAQLDRSLRAFELYEREEIEETRLTQQAVTVRRQVGHEPNSHGLTTPANFDFNIVQVVRSSLPRDHT